MDYFKKSIELHKKLKGKFNIVSKRHIVSKTDLSLLYTPGVAQPCIDISKNKKLVYDYTIKGNSVAVIGDGSRVLALGDIGPEAALPVLEGKCILFKEFAGINAFPLALDEHDEAKTIEVIKAVAPVFGGINLEDIASPRCFNIEAALQDIGIPVFHDDQHGTAIVCRAGLWNAAKVVKKKFSELNVVVAGSGAAGMAITKLLLGTDYPDADKAHHVGNVIVVDSKGIISKDRKDLPPFKQAILPFINHDHLSGSLEDALQGADVFIGVSVGNSVAPGALKKMAKNSIVFPLANPYPEIMPNLAKKAGARIIATGRSDFPNQMNNVLGFPGIFRGALDARATRITSEMKMAASNALAGCVKNPTASKILPLPFDKVVVPRVGEAVKKAAISSGVIRQ